MSPNLNELWKLKLAQVIIAISQDLEYGHDLPLVFHGSD